MSYTVRFLVAALVLGLASGSIYAQKGPAKAKAKAKLRAKGKTAPLRVTVGRQPDRACGTCSSVARKRARRASRIGLL